MDRLSILVFLSLLGLMMVGCKAKPVETTPLETIITGRIVDNITNNGISGVLVTTVPATSSVLTDGSGTFTITNVPTGSYTVAATKEGYKTNSITVAVKEGQTSSADILLQQLTPKLSISTNLIDFGITQTTAAFSVTNVSQVGTLTWSVQKNADWLSVSPTSGTTTTVANTISLTANRPGLSYGNYSTTLTITSNGGSQDVLVTITVQNPNAPQFTVVPLLLDFATDKTTLTLNISNTGTGNLTWSVSSPQSWLSLSPIRDSTRAEMHMVTVQVSRSGLSDGNYAGQIVLASNAGSQNVTVLMSVPPPAILTLSATQLDFGSTLTNLSFNISNSGTGTLSWQVASNQNWLTVNPTTGTGVAAINVYVNRTGLNSGNYSGTISITSNGGNKVVNTSMVVPTSSTPTAVTLNQPSNITFSSIDLSWSQYGGSDFKQYEVHMSTTSGFTPTSSTLQQTVSNQSSTITTIGGLVQGRTYYFKVRVVNRSNLYSDSNERSVTTLLSNTGPYVTDANTIALYHFDEASGATVSDASGNGNNGTAHGTTIVAGKFASGRQFNAGNEYITFGSNRSLTPTTQVTVEFWIYLSDPNPGYDIINYGPGQYYMQLSGNYIYWGVGSTLGVETGELPNYKWTHVAGTYDGSTLKIYQDGVFKRQYNYSWTFWYDISFPNELRLGYSEKGGLQGVAIDELRVSKIARDPSEFHLSKH